MRLNLRQKLLITQTLGAAVLALTMSVLVDRTVVRQVQRTEEEGLKNTRAAFAALKENQQRQLLQQSSLVSDLPHFKAAMAVFDPNLPHYEQTEAVATVHNVADRILVSIDADLAVLTDYLGSPITSAGLDCGGPCLLPLKHVSRLSLQQGTGYEIVELNGRLFSVASVPVRSGGTVFGALCLGLLLDDSVAASLERMSGSAVALISDQSLLASSPGVPERFAELLATGEWSGRPATLSLDGERFRCSWVPISEDNAESRDAFVVLRSEAQALAFLQSVRSGLLSVGIAAALIGLVVAYIFARQITTPVQALVQQTEKLARGNFDARLNLHTGDELGKLAEAFNRMGQSLAESRAQLLQAGKLAAMGELGAGLAHELRQPLTSIRASAQLTQMQIPKENKKTVSHLQLILDAVDHMTGIIQGLKDFSRKASFERVPIHVEDVLHKTETLMQAQLKSGGVRLETKVEGSLGCVLADGNQLQQVFVNLISNARDAMKSSKGVITVTASMSLLGDMVQISVADDGPGIPPDVLPNIFQSFFTTKAEGQGTGLGLPITKSIIQDHGGTLEVETEEGHGTTFTVSLPIELQNSNSLGATEEAA